MGFKQQQGLKFNLRTRTIIIASAAAGVGMIAFLLFFGYFNTVIPAKAKASGIETISAGSFIINMGIVPQTKANGLLPYGMIHDLNKNYNVPVKWVIEPAKAKDGADFVHNGVTYKGGTFIIPAEFITAAVISRIEYWVNLGVAGNYAVSSISVPVYMDITSYPRIMIDNLSGNDSIIAQYFLNAGIPSASYEINSPANLNVCHDIWINPHGDPTWATHQYLYNFVTTQKSFIWMQCHSVSMMEYCKNPAPPFEQLNYLSTTGLSCYLSGKCGTNPEYHAKPRPNPVAYFYPTDPVMQFMSGMVTVADNGSEKWFIPMSTGGWRTTTKRLATVGSTISPREGVILAYGPAFGDTTNGLVMYTGGHSMNQGNNTDNVAGQRSFFNFLILAGKNKAPLITSNINTNINANATDTFSVSVSGGQPPYTYSWTSSAGGTFATPNDSVTEYTAFHTMQPWQTIITCVITDACGRRNFFSQPVSVNASALPINLVSFTAHLEENNHVTLQWKTVSETNNNYFTISRSSDGKNFTPWKNVLSQGNSSSVKNYILSDRNPLFGTSYYRLNQTDYNGLQTSLNIVKIQRSSKSLAGMSVTAVPNPFQSSITVNVPDEYQGAASIRIWNVSGKMVMEKNITIEGEKQITVESLDNLPKGTYVLRVFNGALVSDGIKLIKN